jgi:tRNA pseudouridine55 synthase
MIEKQEEKSGFLLIDKEPGITSHGVVHRLRGLTGIKKIGHAGTLDPFASGLLIIAIGRGATKEISHFVKQDKSYEAEIILGARSATHDPEGEIVATSDAVPPHTQEIEAALAMFIGEQEQIPPMYSAKKIGGKKLYELARQGKEIERKAFHIKIYSLELLSYEWPKLIIRTEVSSGTYIRVLGADIGERLGTGAYLGALRRITIGQHSVENAKKLSELTKENWSEFLF